MAKKAAKSPATGDGSGADRLVFVPLGGIGEIGMNMGLYGYGPEGNERWIMVDCGITFADPAVEPGIETIVPDITFIEKARARLEAIILTHAHEDHYGAVLDLWPRLKVPVYGTPFALGLLEAKRGTDFGARGHGDGAARMPLHTVKPGARITVGPFEVEFISVAHSIPEACALAIRTAHGLVLHTGDWKLDDTPPFGHGTDVKRFKELGKEGVLAVVADSTNAMRDGRSPSEAEITATLAELIREAPGRVIVTTFASHVGRVRGVAEAAAIAGRSVILVGRALERSTNVARSLGLFDGIAPFLRASDARQMPRDRQVLIMTGSQGEPRAAMAKIADNIHPELSLVPGDRVIYSSRTIPGNENAVNNTINALVSQGVEVITDREALVHVSGHPRRGEMTEFYSWIKPQALIPAHGEAMHLAAHATFAESLGIPNVVRARNGDVVALLPGPTAVVGEVPIGRRLRDGTIFIKDSDEGLAERRKLAFAGIVSVLIRLDIRGALIDDPDIQIAGLPTFDRDGEKMSDVVYDIVLDIVEGLRPHQRRDPDAVSATLERALRGQLSSLWGKKPMCHVFVVAG